MQLKFRQNLLSESHQQMQTGHYHQVFILALRLLRWLHAATTWRLRKGRVLHSHGCEKHGKGLATRNSSHMQIEMRYSFYLGTGARTLDVGDCGSISTFWLCALFAME